MRTALAVTVPTAALLALLGCNPPLEENFAPFVDLSQPRTFTDEEGARYLVTYDGQPISLSFTVTDRDGDASFDVRVYEDATPDDLEDEGGLVLLGELTQVTADTATVLTTSGTLTVGEHTLEVRVDDGRREGVRSLRYLTDTLPAEAPSVCWGDGTLCAPDATPGADDSLTGSLPSADTALEAYQSYWVLDGEEPAVVSPGTSGVLDAADTERDDVWQFCIERWDSRGTPTEDPDLTSCTSVTIGNAPPSAVPEVAVVPSAPMPNTPLLCAHADATDAEGDTVTYTYAWTSSGGVSLGDEAWLSPENVTAGNTLSCSVTANDGTSDGPASASTDIGVRNGSQQTLADLNARNLVLYGSDAEDLFVIGADAVHGESEQHVIALPAQSTVTFAAHDNTSSTATYYARIAGSPGDALGRSVDVADVDGSGLRDVAIGALGTLWMVEADVGPSAFTYAPAAVGQEIVLDSGEDGFGYRVALGDITTNTNLDAIVTVDRSADPLAANSIVMVSGSNVFGADPYTLTSSNAGFTLTAANTDDAFGEVLVVADLTGDGQDDLLVGNPSGTSLPGVYLFDGQDLSGTLSASSAHATLDRAAASGIGRSLTVGDFDGDGQDDLAVGAGADDQVAVFYGPIGSGALAWASADVLISGTGGSSFGERVATARETSDLFSDALVVDAAGSGQGAVHVFGPDDFQPGTTTRSPTDADYSVAGDPSGSGPVRLAGRPSDLDGDGVPDLPLAETASGTSTTAYFVRSSL